MNFIYFIKYVKDKTSMVGDESDSGGGTWGGLRRKKSDENEKIYLLCVFYEYFC